MDTGIRMEIEAVMGNLVAQKNRIERMKSSSLEAFSSVSADFRRSKRGVSMEKSIAYLEEADSYVEGAIDRLVAALMEC